MGESDFALHGRGDELHRLADAGVALVPERRDAEGLALDISVLENITVPRVRSRGSSLWTGRRWQHEEVRAMMGRLDIRPAWPDAVAGTLSGGNQQKVLLAKWLAGGPRLLLLHEPTQAVDVGARADIIEAIRQTAASGCAVIVAGTDPQELCALCDRVLILREGMVATELTGEFDEEAVVRATFGEARAGGGQGTATRTSSPSILTG